MQVKILMVCLGNICRSPLAEGILKSKLASKPHIFIDSAGTGGWHAGDPPDRRSIEIARKHGIDISTQKARKFIDSDLRDFDIIYAMDRQNLNDIKKRATTQEQRQKVKLILNEVDEKTKTDVPDPYYGGPEGFENVYRLLDQACDIIATHFEE